MAAMGDVPGGGDWRASVGVDSRRMMINKIRETLMKLRPYSGEGQLRILTQFAVALEGKAFKVATSKADYMKMISSRVRAIEAANNSNPPAGSPHPSAAAAKPAGVVPEPNPPIGLRNSAVSTSGVPSYGVGSGPNPDFQRNHSVGRYNQFWKSPGGLEEAIYPRTYDLHLRNEKEKEDELMKQKNELQEKIHVEKLRRALTHQFAAQSPVNKSNPNVLQQQQPQSQQVLRDSPGQQQQQQTFTAQRPFSPPSHQPERNQDPMIGQQQNARNNTGSFAVSDKQQKGAHGNAPMAVYSREAEQQPPPMERLINSIQTMSRENLAAAVGDIFAVANMVDRIAEPAPGYGSRSAVGEDLAEMGRTVFQQDVGFFWNEGKCYDLATNKQFLDC